MSFNPDDPRITAFLFDELDVSERAAFEAEMQASEALQRAVDDTRHTLKVLASELKQEPEICLSDAQREAIAKNIDEQHSDAQSPVPATAAAKRPGHPRRLAALAAVAASLLLAWGSVFWWSRYQLSHRQMVARSDLRSRTLVRDELSGLADESPTSHELFGLETGEASGKKDRLASVSTNQPPRKPASLPDSSSLVQRRRGDVVLTKRLIDLKQRNLDGVEVNGQDEVKFKASAPNLVVGSEDAPIPGADHYVVRETDAEGKEKAKREPSDVLLTRVHPVGDRVVPVTVKSSTDALILSGSAKDVASVAAIVQESHEAHPAKAAPTDSPDHGVGPGYSGERYLPITENPFQEVKNEPLSTFSIDVDTASYAKVRMYLMQHNTMPRPDAVRIEELVNYFTYDYQPPDDDAPFAAHVEVADCPWRPGHRLARIGIKGKDIDRDKRPTSNLVFLLDVSGSMNRPNKLPLLKQGMKMLVDQLSENDRVAMTVYAGAAGLVLDSTTGDQKQVIIDALDRLHAGGSTNGGQGLQLAYQTALDHFIQGGVNRVILCTDGDFNVGVTGTDELVRMVEKNAQRDIFLSVLGFGMGNHNDAMLEQISNKGNGNYAFVDTESEARKVLVEQMAGTLVTIAKDVKIQIEFNPGEVAAYRLIGYENRILAAQDFNDDKKDAGEIGAGHTVTALYELVPAGAKTDLTVSPVDDLRYQKKSKLSKEAQTGELLTLKIRYKQPDGKTSTKLTFPIQDEGLRFGQASQDFRFAAAVASFGMLLRDSQYKGNATYDSVLEIATESASGDTTGYRHEFLAMVARAKQLSGR